MKALLIPARGLPRVVESDAQEFELDELQELIGGYIEGVPNTGGQTWWCDEEGRIKGKPFNVEATRRWRKILDASGNAYDPDRAMLFGPVLLVGVTQ